MKKKILLLFSMLAIVASVFIIKTSINRGNDVFNANLEALSQSESIIVLEPCIEYKDRICVWVYELNGELIYDPWEDLIRP